MKAALTGRGGGRGERLGLFNRAALNPIFAPAAALGKAGLPQLSTFSTLVRNRQLDFPFSLRDHSTVNLQPRHLSSPTVLFLVLAHDSRSCP